MSHIIDRRLNGKNKSTVNRQRFMERYSKRIKKSVGGAINQRSITDVESGSEISIPQKDLSEPNFHHQQGGVRSTVHPGNKDFVAGDTIPRPPGGAGGGGGSGAGDASNQGEGMDDFTFQINQEEFLEYMFEDLELPNLVEKQLKQATRFDYKHAGFTNKGTPEKLNIVRSLRSAHARRIALSGSSRKEVRELKRELKALEDKANNDDLARMDDIRQRIEALNRKIKRLPFLDEFDLKYNNYVRSPRPSTKAVMICVMDVSGSMTQDVKDIAKRFFILLYLFLKRNYKDIEVCFIRHHTSAKEVDENGFFYSRETGGTIVSSALELCNDVISKRYPSCDWNVYVAQASDGDNWEGDSSLCSAILTKELLAKVQYFSYVEITDRDHQNLWREYVDIAEQHSDVFAMQPIKSVSDIYPVFRKLFERKTLQQN